MKKKKTPRQVIVHWEDAYSRQNWIADEDVDRDFIDGAFHCTMIGYLIRDAPDFVVVAARASRNHETYGLLQRIPRGMLRSMRTLR